MHRTSSHVAKTSISNIRPSIMMEDSSLEKHSLYCFWAFSWIPLQCASQEELDCLRYNLLFMKWFLNTALLKTRSDIWGSIWGSMMWRAFNLPLGEFLSQRMGDLAGDPFWWKYGGTLPLLGLFYMTYSFLLHNGPDPGCQEDDENDEESQEEL